MKSTPPTFQRRRIISMSPPPFTLLFVAGLFFFASSFSQNAIFLHHSTGEGVWNGGNGSSVPELLSAYNSTNGTTYEITERAYPSGAYPWENYPYDYWNLWLNEACINGDPLTDCLGHITDDYGLVIFKHCYPGAGILEDQGDPDVSSKVKTLGNYKEQYRALRTLMDGYIGNKFMVWTLAPLHRLATTPEQAARAKEFVDWVKYDWLTEDGNPHPNIYIFDFFGYVAEQSLTPDNGQTYCLKYEYEGSHEGSDSHPNTLANTVMAPVFFQAIISALQSEHSQVEENPMKDYFYPNPVRDQPVYFSFPEEVSQLAVYSMSGKLLQRTVVNSLSGNLETGSLGSGMYLIVATAAERKYTGKLFIL